jgi:hypothetical protein
MLLCGSVITIPLAYRCSHVANGDDPARLLQLLLVHKPICAASTVLLWSVHFLSPSQACRTTRQLKQQSTAASLCTCDQLTDKAAAALPSMINQ